MKPQVRKVQKLGMSSLGVSLPKEWVKASGVEPGSPVSIEQEEDGSLRISTAAGRKGGGPQECLIDADRSPEEGFLERLIVSGYLVGCKTIRAKAREGLNEQQTAEVQRALAKLTGMTPVEQGAKYMTLENFAEPTEYPVEGLLRRLHFLASRIQDLTLQVIRDGVNVRGELASAGEEVERLYHFAVRQLLLAAQEPTIARQIGLTDPRFIGGDRTFSVLLKIVSDTYLGLAESWTALGLEPLARGGELANEIAKLWVRFGDLAETTMGAHFGRDMKRANGALDKAAKLLETLGGPNLPGASLEGTSRLPDRALGFLQLVLRSLRNVARLYSSMAQVAMNRGLEEALRHAEARSATGGSQVPVP